MKQKQNPDALLIAGLQKHAPNLVLIVQSQQEPVSQVVTTLQGRADAAQAVLTTKAAWQGAVKANAAEEAATDAYASGVRQAVQTMYSNSPQILADFGLVPRKARTPLDAAATLVAVAKRKATRAARHTMGKNQKAEITGTVTGPIVVPVDGSATSTGGASASGSPTTPPVVTATPAAAANGSSAQHA